MNKGKVYKTKQGEAILQCIREHEDSYVTIQQIKKYLDDSEIAVGMTTIYRQLDKFEKQNLISKVNMDGVNGTCYRYVPGGLEEGSFYMQCENCGELVEIECPELEHLYEHVSQEHKVQINPGRTMFYGTCEHCHKQP